MSSHLNPAAIAPRAADEYLSFCVYTEGETKSAELLLALDGGDRRGEHGVAAGANSQSIASSPTAMARASRPRISAC